jgi:mycothiol S-conjugate amidase
METVDGPLRLMAVHAHPDDESSKGAATMARYVREGVEVLVVTCTGGERGSILNPAMDRPEVLARMPELRREEMARAREILGVDQAWLGFVDSGLPEGDPPPPLPEGCFALQPLEVAAAPLVALVRSFRPHVMTTYDEQGGYPHPDHIRTHEISVEAFEAAADPARYPDAGPAWEVAKLYYDATFTPAKVLALHEALLAEGFESPYGDWITRAQERQQAGAAEGNATPEPATTRVPCAEYFGLRNEALLAHATQIDPNGRWFSVPLELQQRVWPTEDFRLASSRVATDLPEDDLFAGLRVGSVA